jgi:hypothetical protein
MDLEAISAGVTCPIFLLSTRISVICQWVSDRVCFGGAVDFSLFGQVFLYSVNFVSFLKKIRNGKVHAMYLNQYSVSIFTPCIRILFFFPFLIFHFLIG